MFTLLGAAGIAMAVAGLPGPGAIILGGSLAMSSTAVAIQVGQGSRGRGVWVCVDARERVKHGDEQHGGKQPGGAGEQEGEAVVSLV